MIKELIPVVEPSGTEKTAIAEMNSRLFSQDAVAANVVRLNHEAAEARAQARDSRGSTTVAAIESEIAEEQAVRDRARQVQETLARLKALKSE
jgi:hypothetical protein